RTDSRGQKWRVWLAIGYRGSGRKLGRAPKAFPRLVCGKLPEVAKGRTAMARIWLAIALIAGVALNVSIPSSAFAQVIKGESKDRKKIGTQSGGGGAGAPLNKPKKKMLNPQPEPPGVR